MTKKTLDKYDISIARELIKDPRQSDNQVARKSGIPPKTVNRKRKRLEDRGLIRYFAAVDNSDEGTGDFTASIMYIIKFEYGIYRKQFLDQYKNGLSFAKFKKHIGYKFLGEKNGQLVLVVLLKSRKYTDILEIFNVEIVDQLHRSLGSDCIAEVSAIPISNELSVLHNYEFLSMKKGKLDTKVNNSDIFVTDK